MTSTLTVNTSEPGSRAQDPTDPDVGNVGPPLPCCEVKLADLPEMNYTTADEPYARGEAWPQQVYVGAGCLVQGLGWLLRSCNETLRSG